MSRLPSDFPEMPRSVGGQTLPNFVNAKIIERNVKMPVVNLPHKFDFSIKKSDAFGANTGKAFDEGATWFPLKLVHMTWTANGASSYRGLYGKGATAVYGKVSDGHELKMSLAKDEYITGISGTYTDRITSLSIITTKTTHKAGTDSGESFKFNVPKDHHVVGFHGRADDHIRALGVSYSRRLASIGATRSSLVAADDDQPNIEPFYSNLYLDANTQSQWAKNDMSSIESKRAQAQKDLQPIYDNISKNGETAWTLVEKDGQQYYLSWTQSATMWAYVKDEPQAAGLSAAGDPPKTKTSIISVGSYSMTSNLLGISGYVWKNIPITAIASLIALTFVYFMKGLISDGVAWGIEFAATQLAEAAAAAGVEELAIAIPASVASAGGLIIAGIIGIALFFAVMALADILFRQYFLTVNVFNFDAQHEWKSLGWYSDNADISNGEWKNESIPKFAPAGTGVTPPGFDPVENLENVVTYLSMAFENDSTFLEGLGIGVLISRDDNTEGIAIKYVVHRFSDNDIGIQAITSDPATYDLKGYYNGSWVSGNSTETTLGALRITGHTPYLSGAPNQSYEYNVNIGLPPA
ncbi:hypothetical protein PLEOSDRAFT_1097387 [Pleurotus ostreatus PC15]|uniref:Jacalin-type lectin domain-containing protein n=1 Tax=Pleurotus ostreatus (strain PC15) TaxID=1137138 RepID=A0A067NJB2_PLEO1|nr:hypothetical protein PLEOSDRAFT_1097387 [Pleurotus ostreatus PC15]